MYFSNFPKIFYDFPQDATSTTLQILTDITTNVRIKKQILENITLYDEYDIKEGETPEMIAEKVYGNPEYHWIIMLANQRYDYLKDFPMSAAELDEYINDKYGADHVNDIHHYEQDKIIVEGVGFLKIPSSVISHLKVNDFIVNEPSVNGRINSIDLESSTATIMLDHGRYVSNETVTVNGIRTDADGNTTYSTVVSFQVPTNGFTIQDNYDPITNYIHEVRDNEKKRRIKLIAPELISQIVREFNTIIKQ